MQFFSSDVLLLNVANKKGEEYKFYIMGTGL